MKRYLPFLLALCLLLCACGKGTPDATTTAPDTTAGTGETVEQTSPAGGTQATTQPTENVVKPVRFRNPLNGTPMDEPATLRPYAITINNIEYAMPQCGVSEADMVFEILAEGGITRCLELFSDIRDLEHLGAIRSARPYLVDIARSFDAIYVHHGGSADGYNEAYNTDTDNLDALTNAGYAYYRDQARLDNGYALEHTSFADGADLIEAAADNGYTSVWEEGFDYGFVFAERGGTSGGDAAGQINIHFGEGGKLTALTYQPDTGKYAAAQYDDDFVDGNTGHVVSFRNVVCISAETYDYIDVYNINRLEITLTGGGDGYFACDGKIVPIRWSRDSVGEPFSFKLEDGTPITLGVGNTYVAVVPLSGELSYEA